MNGFYTSQAGATVRWLDLLPIHGLGMIVRALLPTGRLSLTFRHFLQASHLLVISMTSIEMMLNL